MAFQTVEGFLDIYTNFIRGYKKHYFLLQNGVLSFSKSKTQSPTLSLGFIKVSKATIKNNTKMGSASFRVVIKKKNWLLRASSTEERDYWVAALRDAQHCSSSGSTTTTTRSWASDTSTLESDEQGFNITEVESTLGLLQSQVAELQTLKAQFDEAFLLKPNSEQVQASGIKLDSRWRSLQSSSVSFIDECTEITNQLRIFHKLLDEKTNQRAEASEALRCLSTTRLQLPSLGFSPSRTTKCTNRLSWKETITEYEDSTSTLSRMHYDSQEESTQAESSEKLGNSDLNSSWDSLLTSSLYKHKKCNPVIIRRRDIPERPEHIRNISELIRSSLFNNSTIESNAPMKSYHEVFRDAHPGCYEPLSFLQRLAESFQYSFLLNKALVSQNPVKQITFVGAFVVSTLYATANRKTIPFDALPGETFELDLRREQEGLWILCEQVRHHPVPVTSLYAECNSGWKVHAQLSFNCQKQTDRIQTYNNSIFFLTMPNGLVYTWKGPDSVLVKGSPITGAFGSHFNSDDESVWVDHLGNVKITNSQDNTSLVLNFRQYSFFSSSKKQPFLVSGIVYDKYSKPCAVVQGRWNEFLELIDFNPRDSLDIQRKTSVNSPKVGIPEIPKNRAASFMGESCEGKQKTLLWNCGETWAITKQPEYQALSAIGNFVHPSMHKFSDFTLILNQPINPSCKNLVAPTDSRFRPDVRAFEKGEVETADKLRQILLKKIDNLSTSSDELLPSSMLDSEPDASDQKKCQSPKWFSPSDSIEFSCVRDDNGKEVTVHIPFYQFNGAYLLHKTSGDWRVCPKYLFRA